MKDETIKKYIDGLQSDAKGTGYNLTADEELLYDLGKGLLTNAERYSYGFCPCRLSKGSLEEDMDIICPCDYRDRDLDEYGSCYCGLYVTEEVLEGRKSFGSIPDRRKNRKDESKSFQVKRFSGLHTDYPIWRCKVCGYLCARNAPPEKCPICKAQKERFELFT